MDHSHDDELDGDLGASAPVNGGPDATRSADEASRRQDQAWLAARLADEAVHDSDLFTLPTGVVPRNTRKTGKGLRTRLAAMTALLTPGADTSDVDRTKFAAGLARAKRAAAEIDKANEDASTQRKAQRLLVAPAPPRPSPFDAVVAAEPADGERARAGAKFTITVKKRKGKDDLDECLREAKARETAVKIGAALNDLALYGACDLYSVSVEKADDPKFNQAHHASDGRPSTPLASRSPASFVAASVGA